MKKSMLKDIVRQIKYTRKRYISILLIILLGAGFFSGIKVVSLDMKTSLDSYYDEVDFMDYNFVSTLGFSKDNVNKLAQNETVERIMPTISTDVIVSEADNEEIVKLMTMSFVSDKYEYLNKLSIVDGRLPTASNECVTEASILQALDLEVGDVLKIDSTSLTDDMKDKVTTEYRIVGVVNSPMYMTPERGSTNIGDGKISGFVYVDESAINSDIYTQVYITLKGAKDFKCYTNQYEEYIEQKNETLEQTSEELKNDRYNEIRNEAKKKIDDAQKELDDAIKSANEEFDKAKSQIEDAKNKLNNSKQTLQSNENKANIEFSNAQKELDNAYTLVYKGQSEYEQQANEATKYIEQINNSLQEANNNLELVTAGILQTNLSLDNVNEKIERLNITIEELKKKLDSSDEEEKELINEQLVELENNLETLIKTKEQLELKVKELESNKLQIEEGIKYANSQKDAINSSLQEGLTKLNNSKTLLYSKEQELKKYKTSTYSQINSAKAQIQSAQSEIKVNEEKLKNEIDQANKKFEEAQNEINENILKLDEIEKPDIYLLDRDTVESNVSYLQDADRIDAVAQVFPIIFFVVAALVSLTSMTRMVEEQRGQIGVLKALGYTKLQIASKYLWYAVSASLIGSIIGILVGINLLPRIIFNMYGLMYNMPDILIVYFPKYIILGIVLSVLCTGGATLFACMKELKEVPAALMRPKAPKKGKRVLLERITFIWKRLNFTQKVTCRNILRYKKRFFMTVIGIGGCTGLILVGFGLKDSILSIVPNQYEKVYNYDLQISYNDKSTLEEIETFENTLKFNENIESFIDINQSAVSVINNADSKDANLIVVEDVDKLKDYINLNDRETKEKYNLNSDGVIITEKLARLLDIQKGDVITLKDSEEKRVEVKVTQITENYIMHYVYMTSELYNKLYTNDFKSNVLMAKTNIDDVTMQENFSEELLKNDVVSSVEYIRNVGDKFAESMKSLDSVTLILIISAGLLAFIVLYNLSNINISERIRELATIKVLGFYDLEVSSYVYRENIILTVIGTVLGLVIGFFLNAYIITSCEVDLVMFGRQINFISYIYAILITLVFSIVVNVATHFALKKIDMIEALKSVE